MAKKLGKKTRKFAKKNLQSVMKRKRMLHAMFSMKLAPHKVLDSCVILNLKFAWPIFKLNMALHFDGADNLFRIPFMLDLFPNVLLSQKGSKIMSLRGVWQLQKLVVSYCDWGGSSRGIRAFMETHLPMFKEKNPQLDIVTELIRGQHPHLKAFYKNHNDRVVCVKNFTPEDVLLHATRLRNALGRKVIKLRTRHVTKHPSVQGTWNTGLKF